MRLRKALLVNLGLLGVALAASFAVLEGIVRWLDPPFFSHGVEYHSELGWVGERGKVHSPQRGDRIVRVEYNELGFRDVSHDLEKPSGVRRIVVIGDSFTEAAQVELQETFWSALKKLLNRETPGAWEVIGLGVGAFGTAQELLALEHYGLRYEPDLVIVQVFPFNDVINNSLVGAYVANPHDTYRPYMDPATDFQTVTYLNPKTSWLRRKSAFFRHAFLLLNGSFGSWGLEKTFQNEEERAAFTAGFAGLGEKKLPPNLVKSSILLNSLAPPEHQSEITRQGWAATDGALKKIHQLTRASGARLMIVVIPHVRLFAGGLVALREQVSYPTDLRYPEERIAAVFSQKDVPVIKLVEDFENHPDVILPIPAGHLNAATHQLIAERMLPRVEELFPDPPSPAAR